MNEIKFTLSKEEAELVLNALAHLPYMQSAGMIAKLQQQAQESVSSWETPAEVPAESTEESKKGK